MNTSYSKGVASEEITLSYLQSQGCDVLEWRYKTPVGEVDMVVHDDKNIMFIEVKKSRSLNETTVSYKQSRRILAAAEYYLATHPESSHLAARFDVAVVHNQKVQHYVPNAFWADY